MSLSAWEQHVLDSIKDRLATSDPTLVARLAIFTRLASDEEMPAREKIQASPVHTGRGSRRLGLRQTMPPLLWLVTTIALIAVALVSNRAGSHGTCTSTWATFCTGRVSADSSAPAFPELQAPASADRQAGG
jgi:Protein of unknown function (DUF3040)